MSARGALAPSVFVAGPASWDLLIYLDTLPRPEPHMELAKRYDQTMGGPAAGKTMNLSRLGARVTVRTLVGDDENGRRILSRLRAEGATVIAEISEDPTERHVNLMSDDGGRISLYLELPALDVPMHRAQTAAAMATADAVVIDLAESCRPLLHEARALGRPIWVDLHDYPGPTSFHTDFVECADHVFLSSDRLPDPRPFMTERIEAGARLVVCTHGARGASALTAVGDWYDVAAVPVSQVVDTNGAGDAFFSAFLMATLDGNDVPTALDRAVAYAALAIQSPDLAPDLT